jgi:ATP-dependent Zn protease
MQFVDQYRGAPGFILMAATNFYEGLDEALVRDMRFDEKIRVDLPDEAAF